MRGKCRRVPCGVGSVCEQDGLVLVGPMVDVLSDFNLAGGGRPAAGAAGAAHAPPPSFAPLQVGDWGGVGGAGLAPG